MISSMRGKLKHVLAALVFCVALGTAMVALADEQGTVTVESAKVRASADASSEQIGSVAKGNTVTITGETTGADGKVWYQVSVNGSTGYIRSDLVSKSGSSSDSSSSSTVTETEARTGTVVTNSVNVRKSASTDSSVVATVSSGVTLTVAGQTTGTDGKTWYKVSFKYNDKDVEGYIRADLVTFENVDTSAVSEITGEETTEEQTEEEQEQAAEPETTGSSSSGIANLIFLNTDEVPYIMPGFQLVQIKLNEEYYNGYNNGTFYIVYAQEQNGTEGWYLLDKENDIFMPYPYTAEGVTVSESGGLTDNLLPIIVLVIIIVIMAAVIGILAMKLKGSAYEEYEDEEDYADGEDEIDDIEELEDEEEPAPRQPARRPAPQNTQSGQQVRRPVTQGAATQGQQVRRPAPQSTASQGQQVRRPVTQSTAAQGQQVRRPAAQGTAAQGQQVRRPAPPNAANQQGQRRPTAQNSRPVPKGQKAKNLLEEDDDMDFIDI